MEGGWGGGEGLVGEEEEEDEGGDEGGGGVHCGFCLEGGEIGWGWEGRWCVMAGGGILAGLCAWSTVLGVFSLL